MKFVLFLLILIFGLEIYYYLNFLDYSYESFIDLVMNRFSDAYLVEIFPQLFTRQKFYFLHIVIPGIFTLQGLSLIMLWIYRDKISKTTKVAIGEIKESKKSLVLNLKSLTVFQLVLLTILASGVIFSKIYLINRYPFNGDEALSYFTFVNNGFLFTISFYPEPNNHVFYNLIAILFNQFLENPVYIMRIPNVIISLMIIGIGFFYLLKKQSFTTAIIFLIISGFSFSTSIYAVHGRGYILVSLCTICAVILSLELVKNPASKIIFISLVLASILGMFTISIFIFIFVGISLFILYSFIKQKKYEYIRLFLLYIIFVNMGWIILYLPIFLVSGTATFFNNYLVIPISDLSFYFFFMVPTASVEAIDFVLGTYSKGYILIIILSLFIIYTYKRTSDVFIKNVIRIAFLSLFACFTILIVKRIFGETRVFTMYAFLFSFVISICFSYWINKLKKETMIYIIIISMAFFYIAIIPITFDKKMDTFYGTNYLLHYGKINKNTFEIASDNPENIFVTSKDYLHSLKLFNINQHQGMKIYTPNSKKKTSYDFIIVENVYEFPEAANMNQYQLQNNIDSKALVYKRKKVLG